MNDKPQFISCEPKTIWALEEHERPAAVITLVKECASQFHEAVRANNSDAAQDCAIGALGAIAGLFPPDDETANELLLSIVGVFMGAKAGRKDHILLQRTDSIPGIKRGFGHNNLAAFAIATVKVLTERKLLSSRAARQRVARWLAAAGLSLRNGEHGEPLPVTDSAVREWCECPEKFPIPHAIAFDMSRILSGNLDNRNLATLPQVSAYLSAKAKEAVQRADFL